MLKLKKNQQLISLRLRNQAGQSLLETIVAIFILTTAISAGLGVGIFAFSAAGTSQSEVMAANLAREGVEVVRMMRDSNWLAGEVAGGSYAPVECADISDKICYPNAYTGPTYSLASGSGVVSYNNVANTWALLIGNTSYNLYLQSDGSYTHTVNGTSEFSRKVVISRNTASPFTASNPELIIQSIVGWVGRKCTPMTNQDPSTTNCKITVEEHLTNWKDYK